jgi:hypothetical protein
MNKKGLGVCLLSLVSLAALAGCNTNSALSKVNLTFGKLYDSSLDASEAKVDDHLWNLSVADLNTLISRGDNFALLVYDTDDTCICWGDFQITLKEYLAHYNFLLFGIQQNLLEAAETPSSGALAVNYNLSLATGEETIALYEDGAVKYQKTSAGTTDNWTQYDAFAAWMNDRVHQSDMLYVSEAQFDNLFLGTSSFVVGFLRFSCPDCAYLDDNFLKSYNANDRNASYVIDVEKEGIWNATTKSNGVWQTWKDKYGLSVAGNAAFGFDNGVVPTFYNYTHASTGDYASAILDGDVYVNDSLAKDTNDDNYYVSDTFFTETRLPNLTFLTDNTSVTTKVLSALAVPASDADIYGTAAGWDHKAAAKYHDPLLKAFLDFYTDPSGI